MSWGRKNRSKSLLLSLGLRPCSPMRMLIHVSELPCLTLPIRLVCPAGRQEKPQNKIAAVGSKKKLPWSHNNILRLVIGSA